MNIRFHWNRGYNRTHKDNNRSLCRSRFGLIRRSRRDWKSTCRTDSSCCRCNNRYIHSRPYRLSRKTNKLRTYNSDIRLVCSRYRKKNHKHNVRSSFLVSARKDKSLYNRYHDKPVDYRSCIVYTKSRNSGKVDPHILE